VPLLEFARDHRLAGGTDELNGAGCGDEEGKLVLQAFRAKDVKGESEGRGRGGG